VDRFVVFCFERIPEVMSVGLLIQLVGGVSLSDLNDSVFCALTIGVTA